MLALLLFNQILCKFLTNWRVQLLKLCLQKSNFKLVYITQKVALAHAENVEILRYIQNSVGVLSYQIDSVLCLHFIHLEAA